jgi:ACS family hexuronate transporter-like MFS transporter
VTAAPARGAFRIVALILTAQTLANIGPLGIPAIATLIRDDLDLTLTQAGSFLSAYYVGPSLLSLPAGTLADTWGIKRTLVIGQLVIGLGLVAVSASTSYAMLVVLMAVAGCGYGFLNPTSTKAVMVWSPPTHRATLVGLKQVGLPLGGAIGAALLPVLALSFGWRLAVVVSGLVMGVTALATLVVYRDPPGAGAPAAPVAAQAAVREVLTTRDLWLVAVATGGFAAMQTVWMAFLVLYLHERVGVSLLAAARYLALAQLAGMIGRVVFGLLSDRLFGGRRLVPLVIAGCGSAVCSIAIAFAAPGVSPLVLVPLTAIFGFAGIGWNGVQHTLMAELAGPRAAGTAVGLGLAVSSVGVTVGPPVFGYLVTLSGGFDLPWIGLAVMMAGALALLAMVRERRGALA